MGDRGNIVVRGRYGDVWFYTHWNGSEMKDVIQDVLARKVRWDDDAYLARMIFSELIKDDVMGETGFGISTHMLDNEHGILVVDVPNQKVVRIEEDDLYEETPGVKILSRTHLDYRVSRTFTEYAENGFKGPRKRVERRGKGGFSAFGRRGAVAPRSLGGRRNNHGRRKGD